jgi:DNA-binding XRE family transcriptional regulator
MKKTKNPHVSDLTLSKLIAERDAREPGFKAKVEAHVQQLGLGRQVRALRVRRDLSQADLAKRAGTGQASIARIESGRAIPKLELLARIAAALNADFRLELRAN